MPTAAVATQQRTFNPTSFKRDFQALTQVNPKKATMMAADWRERLENALVQMEGAAATAMEFATVGLSNLGFSTWLGYLNQKRVDMIDRWRNYAQALVKDSKDKVALKAQEYASKNPGTDMSKTSPFKEGKMSDPTEFGIPLSLWFVIGTGGIAYFTRNTKGAWFTRGLTMGAVTTATGDFGQSAGAKMYKNKGKKKNGNGG